MSQTRDMGYPHLLLIQPRASSGDVCLDLSLNCFA